ncbi:aminoacyl-tRNA deacylase [Variovorax sp. YR216]|uniref:aminoacyl-tRNA deacylase n=1 Tax=Variovorax sp. YR216 TaxID=1882828 RepID=UPI000897CDDA|nr:YbaK/EbsC family protein [Variovorax sp. YR216]SEA67817.1 Ala-tRNA(Pro) deacylase [Variovorax sp. YR216]
MSIPSHLSSYLDQRGAHYDISTHARSHSSLETARCANVSLGKLAKSVILEDERGCVMAVVPADRMVMLGEFSRFVGRHRLKLAGEARIAALFGDCEPGAIPPVGMAWGVPTIVDDELESNDVVYMEGGDHEQLLRMSHAEFRALMRAQPHGSFSKTPAH